jgi:hypothetical protein
VGGAAGGLHIAVPRTTAAVLGCWFVGAVVVCAVLIATRRNDFWFYYDEWDLVRLVVDPTGGSDLERALHSFNGRMWASAYAVYAFQTRVLGIDSHLFVYSVLCMSLVALTVTSAAALRVLGVPAVLGFSIGVVLTYLGPAAQNAMFALLFTWSLVLALAFTCFVIVARAAPSVRAALAVAALLTLSAVTDSGVAALTVIVVGVFAALVWRDRVVALVIAPPAAVILAWMLATPDEPLGVKGGFLDEVELCFELLARSAGALVGGEAVAGTVALVVAITVVGFGIASGRVREQVLAATIAGGVGTVLTVVSVTHTRGGAIQEIGWYFFGRYYTLVGAMLLIATVPAIAAIASGARLRTQRALTVVAVIGAAIVFVLNLTPFDEYRDNQAEAQQLVRHRAAETVTIIQEGCPANTALDRHALPFDVYSPQVDVATIARLVDEGRLTLRAQPSREQIARVCRPAR